MMIAGWRSFKTAYGSSIRKGQPSFNYVFPEDVDAAQRLFEAKRNSSVKPFSFRLRRKDGSAVPVEVQGTSMHSPLAGDIRSHDADKAAIKNTSRFICRSFMRCAPASFRWFNSLYSWR
jgi:hypothetical protein